MDSLRLRATDAELIKNRLTFLSRRTIWSKRNPMALVFSVRKRDSKGTVKTTIEKNRQTENVVQRYKGRRKHSGMTTIAFLSREEEGQRKKKGKKENP